MSCNEFREQISAYVDGELDLLERRRVEEHILACPGCLREFDEFRRVRNLVSAIPRIRPPAGMPRQIMGHVQRHAAGPRRALRVSPWLVRAAAAVVAVIAVALVASYVRIPAPPRHATTPPTQALPPSPAPAPAPAGAPERTRVIIDHFPQQHPVLAEGNVATQQPDTVAGAADVASGAPAKPDEEQAVAAMELPRKEEPKAAEAGMEVLRPDGPAMAKAPGITRPVLPGQALFQIDTTQPDKVAFEFVKLKYGDARKRIPRNARIIIEFDANPATEAALIELLRKYGARRINPAVDALHQRTGERPRIPEKGGLPEPRKPVFKKGPTIKGSARFTTGSRNGVTGVGIGQGRIAKTNPATTKSYTLKPSEKPAPTVRYRIVIQPRKQD